MVLRSNYTDLIRLYMDKPFIKVITGVHRCGKSHVLQWVSRELRYGEWIIRTFCIEILKCMEKKVWRMEKNWQLR